MVRKNGELTALEERAALMRARGSTQIEIADELGRSLPWVEKLSSNPLFQNKVLEFEEDIKQELKNQATQGLPEVEAFKTKLQQSSEQIYSVGMNLLGKVSTAIEELQSEEISINRLPSLLKSATDALVCALEMEQCVLGIDRLIEELEAVQKAAGKNFH